MLEYKTQLPRPYPNRELYASTLQKGFDLFPERKANYDKYKAAKRGLGLDYLPIKIDVENVSRCNYHCTMCQVSDWPGFKRSRDMTFEEYKALLDEQIGIVELKLQGMGEPLLGKQTYFDMISLARERSIWVRSVTNGSILHVNDNYKRVIDADVSELHVSFDGATKETYEKIRRGGKYDLVKKNATLLNEYAITQNRHHTRMWVVVQDANFHELEMLPALAAEMGFSRLSLSLDLNDWGQDSWKEVNDQVDKQREFTLEQGHEIARLGEKHGVEVTFWHIDAKFDTDSLENICPWPFERAYISSEMRIVPCCMIANPEILELGDATQFSSEWNSRKMQAFRKAHINGKIPKACQGCYRQ